MGLSVTVLTAASSIFALSAVAPEPTSTTPSAVMMKPLVLFKPLVFLGALTEFA